MQQSSPPQQQQPVSDVVFQNIIDLCDNFAKTIGPGNKALIEEVDMRKNELLKELTAEKDKLQKATEAFENEMRLEKERLEIEKRNLDKLKNELQKQRETIEDPQLLTLSKIKLDVGGTKFSTSLTTLTSQPGSMLAAMFSGRYALKKDEDGSYFIDRNGQLFEPILEWLRNPVNVPQCKDDIEKELLIQEAHYYGLYQLLEMLGVEVEDGSNDSKGGISIQYCL